MKRSKFVLIAALIGLFAAPLWAIEKNAVIKVTPVLKTQTSWDNKPIHYPKGPAEVTGMVVEIAPGGETGWHKHPVPSFGMVLEGELEVTFENGDVRRLSAGQAAAEAVNTWHNGRNIGKVPVKLVVFYAGEVGSPTTHKKPEENAAH